MNGQEAMAPLLRFRMLSSESAEGVRLSSTVEGRARTPTAPWTRKFFFEFATLRRGLTYTPADCREKGVRVLRSSNISEETFILHDDDVFVSEQAANIPFAKNGDILITAANGSSHLVGKHAIVDGVGEKDTVHGGFMLLAESDCSEFLDAAMSAPWYKKFVAANMMGGNGALGNLAKSAFDECAFLAPLTASEQHRIGSFFRSLDALIAGREKALGKLEALKKSMLLKMFPQGDAKVPEVRFKGFEDDWEKKRLGGILDYEQPQQYIVLTTEYVEQGTPVLTVGKTGVLGYTDEKFGIYPASVKPTILFDDFLEISRYIDFDFKVKSSAVKMLSVKRGEESDLQFIAYLMKSGERVADVHSRHWIGSTSEKEVAVPSLPEQQKIGVYFRSLDALIAARREEIEKLKQMKKALLERMFV